MVASNIFLYFQIIDTKPIVSPMTRARRCTPIRCVYIRMCAYICVCNPYMYIHAYLVVNNATAVLWPVIKLLSGACVDDANIRVAISYGRFLFVWAFILFYFISVAISFAAVGCCPISLTLWTVWLRNVYTTMYCLPRKFCQGRRATAIVDGRRSLRICCGAKAIDFPTRSEVPFFYQSFVTRW